MRRLLLGMNQETLAARLGLTFQQVQKYESGANRVSASRLSAIGEVLDVPIGYFYADMHLNLEDLSGEERKWREHLQRPETIELVRVYYAMPDYDTRSQFLQLIKTVADAQAPASEGVAHA